MTDPTMTYLAAGPFQHGPHRRADHLGAADAGTVAGQPAHATRHAPPPPTTGWPPPYPPAAAYPGDGSQAQQALAEAEAKAEQARREVERRNMVVDALRALNSVHAQEAFDRQGRDPLGPHALAFFYHDPGSDRVASAVRLFLDDAQFADPARLVWEMRRVADGYRARPGGLDPRRHLATHVEAMPYGYTYFGVGLSTLDTPAGRQRDGSPAGGPWAQVQQRAGSVFDLPGRCLGLLADGTMLLLDRHVGADRRLEIRSTHTLETQLGQAMRMWTWDRDLPNLADPHTREIWIQLHHLHSLIAGAGHGR